MAKGTVKEMERKKYLQQYKLYVPNWKYVKSSSDNWKVLRTTHTYVHMSIFSQDFKSKQLISGIHFLEHHI